MSSKKVLIVDDSAFTRAIHKQIVTGLGFEVLEAKNGREAVEMFEKEHPDVVMTDLLMPDMDGMDVVREILKIDPAAKTVICSTDRQKPRRQEAETVGVKAFLTKPADPEKMANTLTKLL